MKPVDVTGIWLRTDGDDVVVYAEVGGKHYEVIRDYCPHSETIISHFVSSLGISAAVKQGKVWDVLDGV